MIENNRGFSMIEVIIVITILAILTTASLIYMSASFGKGQDGRRKSDLIKLQNAIEEYYNDKESYPATAMLSTCGEVAALSTYIKNVPCEVASGEDPYLYLAEPSGCSGTVADRCSGYRLLTQLANVHDTAIADKGCTISFGDSGVGCHLDDAGKLYNYGISSGTTLAD